MAYLQDSSYIKYSKKKPMHNWGYFIVLIFIVLIFFILKKSLKSFSYIVAVPILNTGTAIEHGIYGITHSKSQLLNHIATLESQNSELQSKLADYTLIENENNGFKNTVAVSNKKIGSVIARPSHVAYDTLLVETAEPVSIGATVYSISGIPLGNFSSNNKNISTVTLYSNPGNKFSADVILADAMDSITVDLQGRGGGSYESTIPADVKIPIGSLVTIPSISSKPIAEVVKITTHDDTKDQTVYFRSIVNFQYLRYVAF